MIGKPAWFQKRKYGGWGLVPKTWQGWVYIAVAIIPLVVLQVLAFWTIEVKQIIILVWIAFLILDVIHIMANMGSDEREYKIEAISERNSAWAMVTVIAIGVIYQTFKNGIEGMPVDPFLIITLGAGVVAKALSNFYYSRKSL